MKRVHAQLKKLKRHVDEHAKTLKRMEQRGHLTAFRSIGLDAEPWPKWVVELKDHSGCYVIRDATTDSRTQRPPRGYVRREWYAMWFLHTRLYCKHGRFLP